MSHEAGPSQHVYTPPRPAPAEIPTAVAAYLDGTDLSSKSQALRLSTVTADGWPHASLLSAGDMLAVSADRIRFVVFPESVMTQNLARDGRLTMTLALDGGMTELFMHARRLDADTAEVPLAFFEAAVERARHHQAPYADVSSGITFQVHDLAAVLPRWERQIATMRAA